MGSSVGLLVPRCTEKVKVPVLAGLKTAPQKGVAVASGGSFDVLYAGVVCLNLAGGGAGDDKDFDFVLPSAHGA